MRARMNAAARMALQYVLLFGATGVSLPFAGLWFRAQGLSGAEIGALLAAPMLGRAVTGPLLAVWADGFRTRRAPIALLGAVMAAGYAGAGLTDIFTVRAVGWFVGATAAAALIPLSDVLTLRLAARHRFNLPHASQYAFSAILWKARGISEATTGQLWAFGVVVEIALMWLFEPWRRRAGGGPPGPPV